MPEIQRVHSDRVPIPLAHYTQGRRVGDLIFLAGQLASDWKTGVPDDLGRQPGYPFYGSDIKDQTRFVLENIKANLEDAGSDLEHVVKTQVFILDCDAVLGVRRGLEGVLPDAASPDDRRDRPQGPARARDRWLRST